MEPKVEPMAEMKPLSWLIFDGALSAAIGRAAEEATRAEVMTAKMVEARILTA